jgi:hypothetical protein
MNDEGKYLAKSKVKEKDFRAQIFETRKQIIDALSADLEANPHVKAFFLVGSDAQGKVDEYSDIDFDIVLDPESMEEIKQQVKTCLEKFSPIKSELHRTSTKGAQQVIYQLKNISRFLRLDVMFLPGIEYIDLDDGPEIKVLYDKDSIVKPKKISAEELVEKIKTRIERLEKYQEMRQTSVERELNRGNYLEAIEKYHDLILQALVEALRLQYCPAKSDYYLKHITRDLPPEVVKEIEDLFKVTSVDEIKNKLLKANEILERTLAQLQLRIQE